MNIDYTSILILLLFTQWTYSLSLHPLFYPSERKFVDYQNFKSRWPSIERLRRWSHSADVDEIEIPIYETPQTTTFDSPDTSSDVQTIESNTTIVDNFTEQINSTMTTTIEMVSDENSTIVFPLLRQDLLELNQTTISIIEDVLPDNQTEAIEIHFSSTISDENREKNETDFQSDQIQFSSTSSIEDPSTTMSDVSWNETFTTVGTSQEWFIQSNLSLKDAIIINQDLFSNETEIPIRSSKSTDIPICDHSCQCAKECPYGFEVTNDTCLCNPPCKNYPCFNNDTCIVTDKGQPLCQPQNGTEHERPTRCYQPRDAGYHDTNLRYYSRWYYNPDQDTCHLFVYRGLGGNGNNFPTLHQCHSECITCGPLPDPGECLGHVNMWYFDRQANRCKQFEYSGCKGNENKFVKEEQCIDTCIHRMINL